MTGESNAIGAAAALAGGNALDRRPRRAIDTQTAVALLAVAAVGFGTNLAIQLINLGLHARGVGAAWIGFSTMMQAVGIVLVAPLAPAAMRRLGVKETIIAGAALAALSMFGFAETTDYVILNALRVSYAAG